MSNSADEVENPTPPSETEDQPDPLLGSGSFIDPSNGGGAQKATNSTSSSDPLLEKKYPRPPWLPDDWVMTRKVRTSGATVGTVDRYYMSPCGRRLRSKNEVLNFLETGTKRKKSDDATSMGSAPPTKKKATASTTPQTKKKTTASTTPLTKKKTSARKSVHPAFPFDYKNPPEKVSWCLSYATEDVWSPSIGDWTIPLATKQSWASAFNHVSQS